MSGKGVDTRLIQEFLGHRDIRHTVRYTELSPRRLAALRCRLFSLLLVSGDLGVVLFLSSFQQNR